MIKRISLILVIVMLLSTGSVCAAWIYTNEEIGYVLKENEITLSQFNFDSQVMPDGEISLLERLEKILNREYTTDIITDSCKYLLEETIRVEWSPGDPPYVGSMDPDYAFQINELFGDIMTEAGVSFILKNEDLNWDGYNEIAMYSTSDPLDWDGQHQGIVGVYLTVFTPVLDEHNNIVKYVLLCDSIHGYCMEVNYHSSDTRPSFSTDHWIDELSYWHHEAPYLRVMPEEARYTYENYHTNHYAYEGCPYPGWIEFTGRTAEQRLAEIFASSN